MFSVPEGVPEGKRRSALELQAGKVFAFTEPAISPIWRRHEASVYAWDRARMAEALEAAGLPANTQVVPETLMRERGTDGFRLVRMLEGFEGQYWVDGFPRVTRWWSKLPTALEWSTFGRSTGAGYSLEAPPPPVVDVPLIERPWTESDFSLNDWKAMLRTRRAAEIAAVIVVCPFVFLGAQIAAVSIAKSSIDQELESLKSANQKVRQERAEAMENLDAIWDLARLDEYPTQASALQSAVEMLQATGDLKIMSWNYDRGALEIILQGEGSPDPTAFIKLFERASMFENVSGTFVGPERNLQLRMTLTKREKQ
ncbi:MAG: hypothetical protein SFV19_08110 [Rhodospirillaceae bacterium]|nr:hypothetical protein [Rhodospirillaceae bacterium]